MQDTFGFPGRRVMTPKIFKTITTQDFVVPQGVYRIVAELWGAGGGGSSGDGTDNSGGSGGGGGYALSILKVRPGEKLTINIGAGGGDGANGGNSTIVRSGLTVMQANGGGGGTTAGAGGAGGTAPMGDVTLVGSAGQGPGANTIAVIRVPGTSFKGVVSERPGSGGLGSTDTSGGNRTNGLGGMCLLHYEVPEITGPAGD